MSQDDLIHPPAPSSSQDAPSEPGGVQLHANGTPGPAPFVEEAFYPQMEEPGTPINIRRFVVAILRYKWLVLLALLVGSAGAYYVWSTTEVTYTAEGNLWIEVDGGSAVSPIRAGGLLESNAWIELLRSYQVLDTVAARERLLLEVPAEYAPVFQRFELDDPFFPGSYVLTVGTTGEDFVLSTAEGALVQQDNFGVPIGADVGFIWTPSVGAFEAGAEVRFRVQTARDAARALSAQLITGMDRAGNFLSLSLSGENPEKIASILNSVMDRHVEVAAELKRAKLVEVLATLEDQLEQVEFDLAEAERNLEEFRIATISLPSDRSSPIAPGLQITNDPFMANFTQMRVQLDVLRWDRQRLRALAEESRAGNVRIEALEVVPSAANSSELRILLDALVQARSELRVLRDRYSDDYPPIQNLLATISSLETGAIPRVVSGILTTLDAQMADLEGRIAETEAEMEEIPTRTIEEGRLERRLASVETLFDELKGRVEAADLAARSAIPDVRVLDAATVPSRPSEDSRLPLAGAIPKTK